MQQNANECKKVCFFHFFIFSFFFIFFPNSIYPFGLSAYRSKILRSQSITSLVIGAPALDFPALGFAKLEHWSSEWNVLSWLSVVKHTITSAAGDAASPDRWQKTRIRYFRSRTLRSTPAEPNHTISLVHIFGCRRDNLKYFPTVTIRYTGINLWLPSKIPDFAVRNSFVRIGDFDRTDVG